MAQITQRQKFILDKIIQEYIQAAVPVSSQVLEQKYEIGIKPATIRLELQRLTDLGYLLQPHVSAGRVPTDRGYRFFVDEVLEEEKRTFPEKKILEKISVFEKELSDSFKFFSELTKILADFSSAVALTYVAREGILFKEGWTGAFKEPEFHDLNCARDFAIMIQELEKSIDEFLNGGKGKTRLKIFIGRENKIPCAKNFSLILSSAKFPKRRRGILALLGPKRMDYPRNIGLMGSLVNFLEKC